MRTGVLQHVPGDVRRPDGDGSPDADRGGLSALRDRWAPPAIVVLVVVAAAWALLAADRGVSLSELGASWQLIDLRVLGDDPLGSVWHLHTQPPLYNLVVGLVLWLSLPVASTLFALYVGCLVACGLFLLGLLRNWGVHPLAAGAIAAVAVVNPPLLATIRLASYEVPVAMLLAGALWAAQRHLQAAARPPAPGGASEPGDAGEQGDAAVPSRAGGGGSGGWLIVASVLLTTACLTRSLLHPVWLVAALALLAAARPVGRRTLLVAVAVPVLLVGGWMVKNQLLFDNPTLSSSLGFNLQRGVVASMDEDAVKRDVKNGVVSPMAARYPWGDLSAYEAQVEGCTPRHDHPATSEPTKVVPATGRVVANFNDECYLTLYSQATDDAVTLARRYPGRYLRTRTSAMTLSFSTVEGCGLQRCTWMDTLYRPVLGGATRDVDMKDWALPLLGAQPLVLREHVSLPLALATALVLGRGALAAVRIARVARFARRRGRTAGRDGPARPEWPASEVLWVLAAWTVATVVLGGDLVEVGENSRFRAMVDPLLLALPLGALARRASRLDLRRGARRLAATT